MMEESNLLKIGILRDLHFNLNHLFLPFFIFLNILILL